MELFFEFYGDGGIISEILSKLWNYFMEMNNENKLELAFIKNKFVIFHSAYLIKKIIAISKFIFTLLLGKSS